MAVDLETLSKLFAYNRWAHGKHLEIAATLTPEEYTRQVGGSFGSMKGTLEHVYGADWVWMERFHGRSPRALPAGDDALGFEALRKKWDDVAEAVRAHVAGMREGDLERTLDYVNFAGQACTYSIRDALFHLANHGTYHRGQFAMILRQLGRKPFATDYLRWIDAGAPTT